MKFSKTIKLDTLANLNIFLYYLFWTIYLFTNFDIFSNIQTLLGFSSLLFLFKTKQKVNTRYFLFIVFINIIMFLMLPINSNSTIRAVISYSSYTLVSILLLEYKLNEKLFRTSFYLHAIIFFGFMILRVNPNFVLEHSSRNYISIVMILQTTLYYISKRQNKSEAPIIPAMFTFLISMWGIGRSGIFSSIVILAGVLLLKLSTYKISASKILQVLLLPVILMVSIVVVSQGNAFTSLITNIEIAMQRFNTLDATSDARIVILEQYLNKIENYKDVLGGIEIQSISGMSIFNFNLHNSFLRIHAYYGILGIAAYGIGIFFSIVKLLKKRDIMYLSLFLSMIIRISTDTSAFPGVMDSLIIYFIFQEDSK